MTTDDDKVSRRYRELAREEPPRHVDEAILAAVRRAAGARPAPLVAPTGRRWYFPLAAAAIIVLAVAVTMHVERERPEEEIAVAPVTSPKVGVDDEALRSKRAAERPKPSAKQEVFAPDPKPKPAPSQEPAAGKAADSSELRAQRDAARLADLQKAPAAAPASPAAAAPASRQDAVSGMRESPSAEAAAKPQARTEVQGAMRSRATAEPAATFAAASPEQWLQGIADMRRQGRHDEADKALAEFRRAYPDYQISEAMLQKVERQK